MNGNLYEIGLYLFGGSFVLLLIMYIFKTRVDRQFREKMVPLLKKQKATIDKLEKEKDGISARFTDIKKELNLLKNQIALQDTEYEKINFLLDRGIFCRFRNPAAEQHASKKTGTEEKPKEQQTGLTNPTPSHFSQQVNALENWFRFKYLKNNTDSPETEVTVNLQRISQHLNEEFAHKKLDFICHMGEPIAVNIPEEVFEYVSLTFGRLIGERSVSGNTLYFDTDKTGKKCLISLEDSGPGNHDQELKTLLGEPWAPNRLPDLPENTILPVIVAKELIQVFQGNTWYSRIHEIGIKITYSIPILNK